MQNQTLKIVQLLSEELKIKPPYFVVVTAQRAVVKVEPLDKISELDWDDYCVLITKVRRGNAGFVTLFKVDEKELIVSTIRMGMRGSGIKRWHKVEANDGRFSFVLNGSAIMA